MKKNNLWKILCIVVVILILGSWFIPASSFTNGTFQTIGHEPFGIFDILLAPFQFFNWDFSSMQLYIDETSVRAISYASILLVILTTGVFYAILKKTGAYGKLVNGIVKKFEKRRSIFLIGTSIFFILFSAIVGLKWVAFILIPFFITILWKLKYSRVSIFSATFLSYLIGNMVSLTGTEVAGINNIVYGYAVENDFILKGLLFLIVVIMTMIYMNYKREPLLEKEELEEEIPASPRKSFLPIIGLCLLFFAMIVAASYNWYYVFNSTLVTETYEDLVATTVSNYPIGKSLLGQIEPFGYWSGFMVSAFLCLLSLAISFVYALSKKDIVESVKEGALRMAKPAFWVWISMTAMVLLTKSGSGFLLTIFDFCYQHVTSLVTPLMGIMNVILGTFIGDYQAVSQIFSPVLISLFEEANLALAILTTQFTHGIMSLIAPTSFFLVAGLSYLKIPYQKWISYVWKLVLLLFLTLFMILLIINLL